MSNYVIKKFNKLKHKYLRWAKKEIKILRLILGMISKEINANKH